ncbi:MULTISPECIES: GH25 family lysozyme [Enterococcus]|uniref:GH25 family lysozyme n=1 Tax=Enterococcus TaxID=1350 RepID=UPI001E4D493E|nr:MULTISPECIES: GH25 family lysozyme [Enterococcus]MDT2682766.1 GH25 family lysozyme [Enterococcus gallinarum]GMG59102.1 hypothetical protein AH4_24940 [Enterococcus gallinarum]
MSKQTKYFVYICALLPLLFLGNTGTVLAIEIESSSQTLTTETMNETSASNTSTTDSTSTVSSDAEGASNTSSSEKSSQESTKEETQASDESQQETQEEPEKIYDVQGGLDPSSRNRSDLKEQVGIQRRSLRSADVAFIEAGDPSTPSQDFIDVSSHNGIISVEQYKIIKSYGISSVVVKLTEATSYRNPLAASQIANAQAAGLVVHAYHYSWFTTEAQAKAEAEYFVKYAKELKLPTSALMVNDIEDNQIMGKADHTALSKVFANRIKELGYSNTHHYTGVLWVTQKAIDPAALGYSNVWIANYPYVPAGQKFTEYSAWQWTYNLSFPGVSGTFDMSSDYKKYFTGQGQGGAIPDNRYATITKDNYTIWQNFSWKKKADSKDYLGQTLQIKCRYEHSNGSTYYSLYDRKGTWVGYLNSTGAKTVDGAQGAWQAKEKYVKFQSIGNVYRDFTFNSTAPITAAMLKNTYKVTGKYHHFNGKIYDSIKDINGNWIGYVEESKLTIQGDQGSAIADNRYATITGANHSIWQNFSWKFLSNTDVLYNRTFKIKCHYKHLNGSVYLSLYDNKDKWIGYINANGTKISNNISGMAIPSNKYVTINTKNYSIWQNFSGKEKMKSSKIYGKTYQVKCYYNHFNGSTYYSLYDNHGIWQGYINSTGVKEGASAAGMAISSNKYVTINSKNYSIWQNFLWKEKRKSSELYGKTYQVKCYYNHFNGSTYYSLYDNHGVWQGYINSTGVKEGTSAAGMAIPSNKYVTINTKNYSIWQNFSGKEKMKSSEIYGKTYQVKCYYNHFNGSTYYSLYDNRGVWQGYINSTGVK